MKRQIICIMILISCINCSAQSGVALKPQPSFHSYNDGGIILGNSAVSWMANSVNGIQNGKWFIGAGLGIDGYYHTSFPAYLQGIYTPGKEQRKIQLVASAGINFPTGKPNTKFENYTGNYKTGYYYSGGLQYILPKGKYPFFFGAGFTGKQIIQMANANHYSPITNSIEPSIDRRNYTLSTVYVKTGFKL